MSFKLFNSVKKLFQTERQSLIKECHKYYRDVDEKIGYYKKYVKDNYPEYEYSNSYASALLSMGNAKSLISYSALFNANDSILKNINITINNTSINLGLTDTDTYNTSPVVGGIYCPYIGITKDTPTMLKEEDGDSEEYLQRQDGSNL